MIMDNMNILNQCVGNVSERLPIETPKELKINNYTAHNTSPVRTTTTELKGIRTGLYRSMNAFFYAFCVLLIINLIQSNSVQFGFCVGYVSGAVWSVLLS